jgi:hypothetical protein
VGRSDEERTTAGSDHQRGRSATRTLSARVQQRSARWRGTGRPAGTIGPNQRSSGRAAEDQLQAVVGEPRPGLGSGTDAEAARRNTEAAAAAAAVAAVLS